MLLHKEAACKMLIKLISDLFPYLEAVPCPRLKKNPNWISPRRQLFQMLRQEAGEMALRLRNLHLPRKYIGVSVSEQNWGLYRDPWNQKVVKY
jgi:hypothetical protein